MENERLVVDYEDDEECAPLGPTGEELEGDDWRLPEDYPTGEDEDD